MLMKAAEASAKAGAFFVIHFLYKRVKNDYFIKFTKCVNLNMKINGKFLFEKG